ncbi:unnamed protein product [Hymenolepis diminuta]|uniref:SWIRM domain-containing protein n=1 Tax=Hymenolepis diminuta TaxID=6216 RepID=A0A0R3SHA5_HYMDI|nr:unnamed protein product [Hymenolepis diminuta]
MCDSKEESKVKVLKEVGLYRNSPKDFLHFRPASRHLECEGVESSRIKTTMDHIELRVPDEKMTKLNGSIGCAQTLQSTPRQLAKFSSFIKSSIFYTAVDFSANSNCSGQLNRAKVVSASSNNGEKKDGPTRLESRRKTIHNDDDLRYLRELYLDPWREGSFITYEPMCSFERRSILMCPEVPEEDYDRRIIARDAWLLKYLSVLKQSLKWETDSQFDKGDLENATLSLLRQARTVKFDKLFERLPLKLPEGYEITQSDLLALLNKFAILIHGWWCIKSELLYPPKSISPFEGHPREVMIKARDYAMAVFHRGGKLTSKFLMDLTRIHFSEATEILKWLGTRLPPQNGGLSRYWIFREPERTFIQRYPSVVHQQADWWNVRICQLCQEFKLEELTWCKCSCLNSIYSIDQGKEIDEAQSNTVQPVSPSTLCNFSSLHENKSQSKHSQLEEPISSSPNLPTDIISIANGDIHDFERIHSGNTASGVNMNRISHEIEQKRGVNPNSASVEHMQITRTHKGEAEMLLNCSQISASSNEDRLMLTPMQNELKSVPSSSESGEKVRPLTEKQIEAGWSESLDTENTPSKQDGRTESAQNSNLIYLKKSSSEFGKQVLEPPCPTRCDPETSTNDSILPPLAKRAKVEKEVLNENSNEKDENSVSIPVLQSSSSKSILRNQESTRRISDGCTSVSLGVVTENNLLKSCKETAMQTKESQGSLNGYADSPTRSSNPPSKGKQRIGRSPSTSQTKRVGFGNDPIEYDTPIDTDRRSAVTETRLLPRRPLESSSRSSNLAPPVKGGRFENNQMLQVSQDEMPADQTSTQNEDDRGLLSEISDPDMLDIKPNSRSLVNAPQSSSSFLSEYRVIAKPLQNLLKTEPPSLSEECYSSKQSKTVFSVVDDPRIVALVKSRLNSHPIISLSEITRSVQRRGLKRMSDLNAGDNRPPAGSEAERQMLSSDIHQILLAQGAQELNIQWPETLHCSVASPKQPLFVPPPTLEYTNPQDPCIRVRNIILKLLEEKPCVQFGEVKKIAINDGIKLHDGKLRDVIKVSLTVISCSSKRVYDL